MEVDDLGAAHLYARSRQVSSIERSHAKFWAKLNVSGQPLTKKLALHYIGKAKEAKPGISKNYLYSLFNSLKKFAPPEVEIKPKDVALSATRKKTREDGAVVIGRLQMLRHFTSYIKRFDAKLLQLLLEYRLAGGVRSAFSLPDGFTTKYDIDTGIAVVSMLCFNLAPSQLRKVKYKDLNDESETDAGTGFLVYRRRSTFPKINEPFFNKYALHLRMAIEARFILFEENTSLLQGHRLQLQEQPLIECTLDTIYKAIRNKYVYINKQDTTHSLGLRAFRKLSPEALNEFLS